MREKSFNLLLTWHRAILPGSDPPSIFAIATFNNRVRDGSEWFHYIISTRKALKTLNPVSAFSLMRCISFARPNYITKLSPVCQPLGEIFFFDDVMESDEGRETGFLRQYPVAGDRFRKNPVSASLSASAQSQIQKSSIGSLLSANLAVLYKPRHNLLNC